MATRRVTTVPPLLSNAAVLSHNSQAESGARSVPLVDDEGAGDIDVLFSYLVPAAASAETAALTKDEKRAHGVGNRHQPALSIS